MFDFFDLDKINNSACMSFGKCSNDPMSTALNETFIYEIRQLTYYILKIKELGYENLSIVDTIINTFQYINSGFSYPQKSTETMLSDFRNKKQEVISFYKDICRKKNLECQMLQYFQVKDEDISFIKALITGEKQSITKNTQIPNDKKNLYEIMLILIKKATSVIIKLADYGDFCLNERYKILEFLNVLNFLNTNEEKLTKKIIKFANIIYGLNKALQVKYTEEYGQPSLSPVKIETVKGKAILISGDNFKDLENLLKATSETGINIYTHDHMILALQYPYFKQFPHLIGHYQHKDFNFSLDFSEFPGPILLTKDYLNNVDSIYRANLFSTDTITGKSINPIKNCDFKSLINAANEMKGFKFSENRFKLKIGYKISTVMNKIEKITTQINNGNFENIYIVGLLNYGYKSNQFFEQLYEKIGTNNFIISLAYEKKAENILHLKSFFDFSLVYKIIERLKSNLDLEKHKIKIILTQCTTETLTNIFIFKSLNIEDIYITCFNTNTLNPSVTNCLINMFNIKQLPENIDENTKL